MLSNLKMNFIEEPSVKNTPDHVGIIMDGNGRWAQRRGMSRMMGHRAGVENIRGIIQTCVEQGITHLTLYAFSTENWKRPRREVEGILELIGSSITRELNELDRSGVQLRHLGSLKKLPPATRARIHHAISQTRDNSRLTLNLAFNYGGRAEITQAVQRLVRDGVTAAEITEKRLGEYLFTAGQPDPALIIRTGGEMRLSNFLLWQAAYTEFYSTDVHWPDFGKEEFIDALENFRSRDRRFGGLKQGDA